MFITTYKYHALYEPAEGGHYYDCWGWSETYKVRGGKAKKRIRAEYNKLAQIAKERNEASGKTKWYAYISNDGRYCELGNDTYSGQGCHIVAESKRRHCRGERG